jgi:hypothetical protein
VLGKPGEPENARQAAAFPYNLAFTCHPPGAISLLRLAPQTSDAFIDTPKA